MANFLKLAGVAILIATPVAAKQVRSQDVPREFQRLNPCPATGWASGPCLGWERDHIIPLCLGGADHPVNLQWLTVAAHAVKTKQDILACRTLKGRPAP